MSDHEDDFDAPKHKPTPTRVADLPQPKNPDASKPKPLKPGQVAPPKPKKSSQPELTEQTIIAATASSRGFSAVIPIVAHKIELAMAAAKAVTPTSTRDVDYHAHQALADAINEATAIVERLTNEITGVEDQDLELKSAVMALWNPTDALGSATAEMRALLTKKTEADPKAHPAFAFDADPHQLMTVLGKLRKSIKGNNGKVAELPKETKPGSSIVTSLKTNVAAAREEVRLLRMQLKSAPDKVSGTHIVANAHALEVEAELIELSHGLSALPHDVATIAVPLIKDVEELANHVAPDPSNNVHEGLLIQTIKRIKGIR